MYTLHKHTYIGKRLLSWPRHAATRLAIVRARERHTHTHTNRNLIILTYGTCGISRVSKFIIYTTPVLFFVLSAGAPVAKL